jgi:glycosyltransferase involved in cell wall biosynthesis
MKVLIAASIYPPDPGGPATHAKAQFEELPKYDIDTRLVAFPNYRHWPKGVRHLLYLLALIRESRDVEVIYAHDAISSGLPALAAAAMKSKKIIIRIGGDRAWESNSENNKTTLSLKEWYEAGLHKGSIFSKITRFVLRRTDMIIVPSPLLAELYIKYYGVPATHVKIIPNPVPSVAPASGPDEQTIVYASRLVAYKNLPFTLKVLATIFPDHPDLRFIVMGDGPERGVLEKLSKKLGISNHIVFTGSVPHSEVLSRASSSLFALAPALTEFNPNYVLEAVSAGKPFLISRENGFAFNIPEDLVFDPRNGEELKERILVLLTPEGYKKAQIEVKSLNFHWTWEDNLRSNADLIKKL